MGHYCDYRIIEMNFALIAICLPALSQLYKRSDEWIRSIKRSRGASSGTEIQDTPKARSSGNKKRSSISQFVDSEVLELGLKDSEKPVEVREEQMSDSSQNNPR
jgi:hypothetical protein